MAHGYGKNYPKGPSTKYGGKDKSRTNDGPGKNAQHGEGGHHSQKPKGNKSPKGGSGKRW